MLCVKFTETVALEFWIAEDQSLTDEYDACCVESFMASSREAISEVSEVPREGGDPLDEVHVDELDLDGISTEDRVRLKHVKTCLRQRGCKNERNRSQRGEAAGTSQI